jgi:hypothetical protein
MIAWVNDELFQLDVEKMRKDLSGENALAGDSYMDWLIDQAEHGDIEPLRRHFPRLAPYLHLPKRKRGQRFLRDQSNPVRGAVNDVTRIRAIWKKHFGRKTRPKTDLVSAEQIAADRWEVDVDTVINRMKKSPLK